MKDCKIDILGAEWEILFRKRKEDKALKTLDGYCDFTVRKIVIRLYPRPPKATHHENPDCFEKQSLRHEIVHAFLYESGLGVDTNAINAWAKNEEMIDWIAFQHEKLHKAFEEGGAL